MWIRLLLIVTHSSLPQSLAEEAVKADKGQEKQSWWRIPESCRSWRSWLDGGEGEALGILVNKVHFFLFSARLFDLRDRDFEGSHAEVPAISSCMAWGRVLPLWALHGAFCIAPDWGKIAKTSNGQGLAKPTLPLPAVEPHECKEHLWTRARPIHLSKGSSGLEIVSFPLICSLRLNSFLWWYVISAVFVIYSWNLRHELAR